MINVKIISSDISSCNIKGELLPEISKLIQNNISCKEDIDVKIVIEPKKEIKEYRGILWKNNMDLSLKLGKCPSYVGRRLQLGKTYEEIIDKVLSEVHHYKDFTWKNDTDLSLQLGKNPSYVNFRIHEGKSYEEIIDHVINGKWSVEDINKLIYLYPNNTVKKIAEIFEYKYTNSAIYGKAKELGLRKSKKRA